MRDGLRTRKDLDVWKKAIDLAEQLYLLTGGFPKEEQFGLTSQLRRAAESVASNIAEGAASNSDKEFQQFLYIALGSAAETETQLLPAKRLKFLEANEPLDNVEAIRKMLLGLIKFLKGKMHE